MHFFRLWSDKFFSRAEDIFFISLFLSSAKYLSGSPAKNTAFSSSWQDVSNHVAVMKVILEQEGTNFHRDPNYTTSPILNTVHTTNENKTVNASCPEKLWLVNDNNKNTLMQCCSLRARLQTRLHLFTCFTLQPLSLTEKFCLFYTWSCIIESFNSLIMRF